MSDHELAGARVEAFEQGDLGDDASLVGMRVVFSNHSYESGSALEVHFGLGERTAVDAEIRLPAGRIVRFRHLRADRFFDLDLANGTAAIVYETVD